MHGTQHTQQFSGRFSRDGTLTTHQSRANHAAAVPSHAPPGAQAVGCRVPLAAWHAGEATPAAFVLVGAADRFAAGIAAEAAVVVVHSLALSLSLSLSLSLAQYSLSLTPALSLAVSRARCLSRARVRVCVLSRRRSSTPASTRKASLFKMCLPTLHWLVRACCVVWAGSTRRAPAHHQSGTRIPRRISYLRRNRAPEFFPG